KDFIKSESISLSQLLDRVRATGARTTIAVIDACRNNPFATAEGRSIGTTRGLGRITAPQGSFVIFSAGAGQLALDELGPSDPGRNSVFTRMLLPRLSDPELELRALMSEVRSDVRELALTVNHQQFPAYYDELLGDFYFARTAPSPTETAANAPEPADPPQSRMAAPPSDPMRQDFELARSIGTEGALRAFLNRYSDRSGDFTYQLAAQMLEQMQSTPATAPKPHTAQPDLSRRDIILQTQQGLTARGCAAGTADGVIGTRTRRAFADFLAQSGADLTPASLGTQAALTAVIATTGTICQPTATSAPVAQTAPAATGPTLAGSWSFTANCPLFIPTPGTVRLRDAGQGRYIGTMSDSLGQTAQLNLQLNGLAFTATEIYPHTTIAGRGRLSADGQSYTSATAAGCKVQARKR
ncbi:MAG: caspase family protein, partial [Pseudomonadota bacterium]|nr:caspase family protein [Pseudomonadota bacterium]